MKLNILLFIVASVFSFCKTDAFAINPFEIVAKPFGSLAGNLFNWDMFNEQALLESIQNNQTDSNKTTIKRDFAYGCRCQDNQCYCCSHIEVNKIKLNETGCLNMTYSNLDNIELTFDLGGRVLYHKAISIVNPPDLCFPTNIPVVDLCLKFYQLDARNKSLSGSVDLLVKVEGKQIARIKLGTFHFGNKTFYEEHNIMTIYYNNDNLVYSYGNETDKYDKFSADSKNLILNTYENFVNNFEKLSLPQLAMDFKPDKFITNFLTSIFGSRTINKGNSSYPDQLDFSF